MNVLTQISRILVGLTFIYSGFVKLVDPLGTKIKLLEYFSEGVLNLEFLSPYALFFSVMLVIAEFVLGVMLIVGFKPKFTVWSIFSISVLFLFLTWYSFAYNKVTDCGCFGDALKLTPAETFYKNVILMVFVIILILGLKHIKPFISRKIATITSYGSVLLSAFVVYYVLNHLPIVDFRAYAVGTNITESMKYQGDGEVPPIHDFMIDTDQGDKLQEMLAKDKALLLIMVTIEDIDEEALPVVQNTAQKATAKGYEVYVLTSSYIDDLPRIQKQIGLPYTIGMCDATALKTAIRANPGIITVEKGIITGKWNWTDAEDVILKIR